MIEFKSCTYKNFQAVGNAGLTVELDRSQNTLLGGNNGSGKSTVLEALSYCLYGKPLKKVKLSGLINTINRKGMLTECVFRKYGDEYKVVRGEKPKKFEIWKNDELLDQNAASKDYQATLENILGMDHKLFTQVVLLNRERYIPFMDMGAADRRKVVEDILDINVFGYMNKITKDKLSTIKYRVSDLEYERDVAIKERDGVKNLIDQANENTQEQIDNANSTIDQNKEAIKKLEQLIKDLEKKLAPLDDLNAEYKKLKTKKDKYALIASKFSDKISTLKKERKFYDENDECPTCTQPIDQDFKTSIVEKVESKEKEIKDSSVDLTKEVKKIVDKMNDLNEKLGDLADIRNEVTEHKSEISMRKRTISNNEDTIESLKKKKTNNNLQAQYDEVDAKITQYETDLQDALSEQEEYNTMLTMLKDDGIKATIVDDYVGFINKRMNEYLNHMGFFINITLDGNFDETINSVSREGFTYDNLSTGQKTRVNLAILMVLLEVSGMKNSAVCNVIFIDELLENLDQDGVQLFMDLIKDKMKHKNIFVITQRYDEFKDYFRSEIYFKLGEDGFTAIE